MTDKTQIIPPEPRRYYWLKRLSIGAAVVLCLLGIVRWWWGMEAEKRLQVEIAKIHARGEPIFMEDFAVDPVADEDNAAKAMMEALAMWNVTNMRDDQKYLADNAAALALVRDAQNRTGCDWGIKWTSPAIAVLLPHLGKQRDLARKLVDVAKRQHKLGNHVQAIRTLQHVMHLAQLIDRPPNCLINHLVAISIHALAYEALETLLPTMPDRADVRRELALFRDYLLEEQVFNRANVRAYFGERMSMLGSGLCVLSGKLSLPELDLVTLSGTGQVDWLNSTVVFTIAPLIKLDMAYMLKRFSQHVQDAQAVRLEDTLALRPEPLSDNPYNRYRYPLTYTLEPATGAAMKVHLQLLAKRRMTAIAIAIRLFEYDHGQRPKSLDVLVPDYLPVVSEDPLASKDELLKYNGTLLYSVGTNGVGKAFDFQLDVQPVSSK